MESSQASTSWSRSEPRRTVIHYSPQTEDLGSPDGDLEATEGLQDSHPLLHQSEGSLEGPHEPYSSGELNKKSKLPWWKTPSPWWLLIGIPLTTIAASATMAPRVEIYTTLACNIHRPDIFGESFQPHIVNFVKESNDPQIPAVVHRSGSVDVSDIFEKSPRIDDADTPPTRKQRCASDPVVQAAVAKLTTVIAASMGILGCITTGWWGAFSDRHGRTIVLRISVLGLILADFNFIMVTLFSKHMPGGYWFLVVGPMLEGTLGGMAAGQAYLADTSNESNSSRIFSLNFGLVYIGMTLGPTLGSLLIRFTGQTLSVIYMGSGLHILYACLVWFIPESLTKSHMALAKARYAVSLPGASIDCDRGLIAGFIRSGQCLFSFLRPLMILGPTEEVDGNPLKGRRKNWNLTFLAAASSLSLASAASSSYTLQYVASAFRWSSETIGYWLTFLSGARAIFLVLILPIVIKVLKPKPLVLELPATHTETISPPRSSPTITRKTLKKEIHSPLFDLNLARASLLVDVVTCALMGVSQSPISFVLSSSLGTLGSGFNPAIQSVALALYAKGGGIETGKLLGALNLILLLSYQILGPFIYGVVYINTVAVSPRMLFFVSAVVASASFYVLSLVKMRKEDEYHGQGFIDLEEPGSSSRSPSHCRPE